MLLSTIVEILDVHQAPNVAIADTLPPRQPGHRIFNLADTQPELAK
jgi:hypothetical protein